MTQGRLRAVACILMFLVGAIAAYAADAPGYDEMIRTDVLVVGATPCGIAAAIAVARCGSSVILTDTSEHMGGMMTSGLGVTDIGPRHTIGGIFQEFIGNNLDYYVKTYGADSEQVKQCSVGFHFEPSVGERTFNAMVKAEKKITLHFLWRPESTLVYKNRVHGVTLLDIKKNRRVQVRAGVTIDATYEGDVAAMAGCAYRVGRESREEYGESYAGVLYMDHFSRMVLEGSTGDADNRVQSYNFRLCLTDNPANRVMPAKPQGYNRDEYLTVLRSASEGRVKSVMDILNIIRIPNGKSDTNNTPKSLISTDLPEENYKYPEASYEEREKIIARHRNYILGLLYFLQNDKDMPAELQADCAKWGFAKDEYTDNNNFPRQIYVREARRIYGLYNFTQHDALMSPGLQRAPIQYDSIACGGYAMDSHATRKREEGHDVMEGFYYLGGMTQPYQIPYRVMVPQSVDALLVPGAASGTHIGFGTLRMEPVWMAMGQAAGTAAHIARNLSVEPRDVPVSRLQGRLIENGQVITTYTDAQTINSSLDKKTCDALQFWGTRGFFDSYQVRPTEAVTRGQAASWLMAAYTQGDFMTWFGPYAKHASGGSGESSLAQLVGLKIAEVAGNPDDVLTRGQMAVWLCRMEPWLDGGRVDNWSRRVKPVTDRPVPDAVDRPDDPVTRAEFCAALYARYRYATPTDQP